VNDDRYIDLENGERYLRYAERVPHFLKEYPPKEGYRVLTEMQDLLSLQPGRLSLLREAIAAGKKLSDLGLPGLEDDINTMVCVVKLLNAQAQIVRTASALCVLKNQKDFEILETAANQRLLAALGFDGSVFNADENADLQAQGVALRTTAGSQQNAVPSGAKSTAPVIQEPAARTGNAAPGAAAQVPPAQRRQIENLAKSLGEAAPVLNSPEDASAELRRLGEVQRQRRAGSGRPAAA
jgi:hypothetical protein